MLKAEKNYLIYATAAKPIEENIIPALTRELAERRVIIIHAPSPGKYLNIATNLTDLVH